jgi:hypothetical protein
MTRRSARAIQTMAVCGVVAAGLATARAAGDTKALDAPKVTLVEKSKERRVDILVDGKPFTAYIWPTTLKKPTLHPIQSAEGVVITRGFPPEPGERADHPHHVGLWFNYGDVNGFDFWNNSDAVTGERAKKMGSILHQDITRKENGKGRAELGVKMTWVTGAGNAVLEEETLYTFHAKPGIRMIDRVALLRPTGSAVSLKDNKEGMIGLRVRRALEDPAEKSGQFVDKTGGVVKVADADTSAVTGVYTSSEGKKGKDVWGTRGRWTMLAGQVDGKPVTIAMLDHPGNPGHPTYWHARGYGLFAANTLGQGAFTDGKEQLNFVLPAGQSQFFRYRVIIFDSTPTPEDIEREYAAWTGSSGSARR